MAIKICFIGPNDYRIIQEFGFQNTYFISLPLSLRVACRFARKSCGQIWKQLESNLADLLDGGAGCETNHAIFSFSLSKDDVTLNIKETIL